MSPTPEWTAADEDDDARARSSFDRADNTARLALEVADLKRERAALVAEVERTTTAGEAAIEHANIRRMTAEAEVRDLRAKVAAVEALADQWSGFHTGAGLLPAAAASRLRSLLADAPDQTGGA